MEFVKASKIFYLNKSTYVNLRWIAIIGQLITILTVEFLLNFKFDYFFIKWCDAIYVTLLFLCIYLMKLDYVRFRKNQPVVSKTRIALKLRTQSLETQ